MAADLGVAPVRKTHRPVMGTMASIGVCPGGADAGHVDVSIEGVFIELERLEAMFSTFRPDSEICQLNRGERHLLDCSVEVIDVLDACTWLHQRSGGAFDIARPGCPGQIDPAGFVKGWATERAAQRLSDAGLTDWFVSVGGDVITRGSRGPGDPWSVAIADPRSPGEIAAVFDLSDGLGHVGHRGTRAHLWDGRDETPAAGWASLSVTGPSLAWAGAFATAAFVMGAPGPDWVAQFDGYAAIGIDWDGSMVTRD